VVGEKDHKKTLMKKKKGPLKNEVLTGDAGISSKAYNERACQDMEKGVGHSTVGGAVGKGLVKKKLAVGFNNHRGAGWKIH